MNYLKLMRVKHWLKNILVFLPLFFSNKLFDVKLLLYSFFAFFVFSLVSSIVYIINDIKDVEKDKLHPIKRRRPLASGAISIMKANCLIVILFLMVGFFSYILFSFCNNILIFIFPFVYIILNIMYSFGFKNLPIIDVSILVSGFLLRVAYGGVAIGIYVSKFLYLMVIFGSYYLGFGKRRNEIIKNGDKSRKVLSLYNKSFLDKNMYVSLTLTIVSYTLWTVDQSTLLRIGNDYLYLTVPLLMIIFQLYSLDIEGDSYGDPIDVVLSNKYLIVSIITYIIILFLILYIL